MTLRVDRFLNAIYAWCLPRIDPQERDKWLFQLNAPIPGRVTQVSAREEMDSFAAFAGAFGVTQPSTG
jgi:hypothetical protein